MSRSALTKAVADASGLGVIASDRAVVAVLGEMKKIVSEEGRLSIRGLGTFHTRQKAERTGRNPKTGRLAKIKARRVVQFKAGRIFKNLVNGGLTDENQRSD
jgi:DNA-binding protein HU-beta